VIRKIYLMIILSVLLKKSN